MINDFDKNTEFYDDHRGLLVRECDSRAGGPGVNSQPGQVECLIRV